MMAAHRLFRPAPELASYIAYYGYLEPDGKGTHRSRALPRGAATVVVDLDSPGDVNFLAADGHTRLAVPPAFIVGAGTASFVTHTAPEQETVTIHFRPGGAWPFLGNSLRELEDAWIGLNDVWGSAGMTLHERLVEARSAAARIRLLNEFLTSRARLSSNRQRAAPLVLDAIERNPSLRMSEIRESAGMSAKQLIELFRCEVGMAPKAYARVRRFQRALRCLDSGLTPRARLAVQLGYFDQAHFVREFRFFTGMSPTRYVERELVLPSHVEIDQAKISNTAPAGVRTMTTCPPLMKH